MRLGDGNRREAGADVARAGRHGAEGDVADDAAIGVGDEGCLEATGGAEEVDEA